MVTAKRSLTAEDLLHLPDDGHKYELVGGELKMVPTGMRHEKIGMRLAMLITRYLEKHPIGEIYGSSTGYRLPSGDVRSPDLSFVRLERLPEGKTPVGFGDFPPDLAVEILSPGDNPRDVSGKLGEYLGWGVPEVWIVDPDRQTVTVYRSLTDVKVFRAEETLSPGEILPGFSLKVAALFS